MFFFQDYREDQQTETDGPRSRRAGKRVRTRPAPHTALQRMRTHGCEPEQRAELEVGATLRPGLGGRAGSTVHAGDRGARDTPVQDGGRKEAQGRKSGIPLRPPPDVRWLASGGRGSERLRRREKTVLDAGRGQDLQQSCGSEKMKLEIRAVPRGQMGERRGPEITKEIPIGSQRSPRPNSLLHSKITRYPSWRSIIPCRDSTPSFRPNFKNSAPTMIYDTEKKQTNETDPQVIYMLRSQPVDLKIPIIYRFMKISNKMENFSGELESIKSFSTGHSTNSKMRKLKLHIW